MILVTGSSGYIGSHITSKLDNLKIKYVGVDNFSYSSSFNISKKKKFFFSNIGNKRKINQNRLSGTLKSLVFRIGFCLFIKSDSLIQRL